MNYDFLFTFVEDHEYEGEYFLCEEPTLEKAYETLEKFGIHKDEIRFIEKMSVEDGEWLGLDTY